MNDEIIVHNGTHEGHDHDVFALGRVFAESGYFNDARDAAQATVKILAGRELGLPPFASMTGIHIIKGKPTLSANLLAARIKASKKYDYRVAELNDKGCRLIAYENGKQVGESTFSIDDSRRAGTQNIDRFPRNMLFARAVSNLVRWYMPDLFVTGVYTPEEMGSEMENEPLPPPPLPSQPQPVVDSKRDKMLARVRELGGDVTHAETLNDQALVAYGKSLSEVAEGAASAAPAVEAPPTKSKSKVKAIEVVGELGPDLDKVFVSDKVCKFELNTGGEFQTITVFPQRSCWAEVVQDGEFVVGPGDVVLVHGKPKHDDKYGDSIIADSISVRRPDDEVDDMFDEELVV